MRLRKHSPAGDVPTLAIQREMIVALQPPSGRGRTLMNGMYTFANDGPINLEGIRAQLRSMNEDALLRYGRSASYMASPQASHGRKPLEAFVVKRREARAEWRRRRLPELKKGGTSGAPHPQRKLQSSKTGELTPSIRNFVWEPEARVFPGIVLVCRNEELDYLVSCRVVIGKK
jgi:hypothetical protein